jgi:hypothetical protein
MGDPLRILEYRMLKSKQQTVNKSKNFWGERYPHERPHVSARREKGAQARALWELRANGKLVLPSLPLPPDPGSVPGKQWRPIAGMVVFTEKKPPAMPVMEAPERRNGKRVEKARWFSHLDG